MRTVVVPAGIRNMANGITRRLHQQFNSMFHAECFYIFKEFFFCLSFKKTAKGLFRQTCNCSNLL